MNLLNESSERLQDRYSLVQDDVATQGDQQLLGPSSVEMQRRQRVAASTRQYQKFSTQGEARPPEGVELGQRQ